MGLILPGLCTIWKTLEALCRNSWGSEAYGKLLESAVRYLWLIYLKER